MTRTAPTFARLLCIIGWSYYSPCAVSLRPLRTSLGPNLMLVQIADPQLGMLNMYHQPTDWAEEETMLQKLATQTGSMKPDLVFLAGDMQNWWPNEGTPNRNMLRGMSESDFEALKAKNLGKLQRDSVRRGVKSLLDQGGRRGGRRMAG
eukprot:Skav215930  [mRNA]  locus=scaffold226:328115:331081:+ [translate_table: standard]